MPSVHFQMELAVPTIADQTRLLGWPRPSTLYGGQILREHDPTFQFVGSGIRTIREIYHGPSAPERPPLFPGRRADRFEARQGFPNRLGRERKDEFQSLTIRAGDLVGMRGLLHYLDAVRPDDAHVVTCLVRNTSALCGGEVLEGR